MKISRSPTVCILAATFALATGFVVHGAHRIAKEQKDMREGKTLGSAPFLKEVFYDCSTERDYKKRIAVITCKIRYEHP